MGNVRPPIPVKLFVGMLSPDPGLFDACAELLRSEYGPIDYRTEPAPWTVTDYYRDEMGPDILRAFIFFERLMDPAKLPGVKHFTNRVEQRFTSSDRDTARRRINLDPGYVTEAKVVLATTKDFTHRVYIGEGIYADVTLRYQGDRFLPFDFTYPDYRTSEYREIFSKARKLLRASLK
jgi:hypothetical protein